MVTDEQYTNILQLTPVYVCDHKLVVKKLQKLDNILRKEYPNYKIAYSFKTNYSFAQSEQIKKLGLLAEVVSEKEFNLAKKNGFKDENIIFNGPNKNNATLCELINRGVKVNIDNFSELNYLINKKIKESVGIRVNTNIKNFPASRFGFNIENGEAVMAIELLKRHSIEVDTIHCHIGTNINSLFAYKSMAKNISNLVTKIRSSYGVLINCLDLGGGFPSSSLLPSSYSEPPLSIESIVSVITKEIKKTVKLSDLPKIIFEPGRYLVDDATFFFTKVLDSKIDEKKQNLTINTTINAIPSVWYKPQKIRVLKKFPFKSKKMQTTIYGSSCQENDIIFTGSFPECKTNDILIFYSMGAYNASIASDFIFDKPKEIVI